MSWSYVATANGSTSAASFSPTWPAGLQEGDVVVFCLMFAPDTGSQSASVTSSPGWKTTSLTGGAARFMWCRYSAAQALPVIALTGGPTATWYTVAFRTTVGSAFGSNYNADGTPPATTSITTVTPNTLLFIFGSAPGDQSIGWTFSGSSAWTTLVNINGNGTGNPNFANIAIGWQQIASPTAVTGLRVTLTSNRYFILVVGESGNNFMFAE